MAVPYELNPDFQPKRPEPLFTGSDVNAVFNNSILYFCTYGPAPDGRFVVVQENGDGAITVVQNWHTEFEGRD
jgi:hypothetical protein